jgi:hypothetical protein
MVLDNNMLDPALGKVPCLVRMNVSEEEPSSEYLRVWQDEIGTHCCLLLVKTINRLVRSFCA